VPACGGAWGSGLTLSPAPAAVPGPFQADDRGPSFLRPSGLCSTTRPLSPSRPCLEVRGRPCRAGGLTSLALAPAMRGRPARVARTLGTVVVSRRAAPRPPWGRCRGPSSCPASAWDCSRMGRSVLAPGAGKGPRCDPGGTRRRAPHPRGGGAYRTPYPWWRGPGRLVPGPRSFQGPSKPATGGLSYSVLTPASAYTHFGARQGAEMPHFPQAPARLTTPPGHHCRRAPPGI
jgi:hypothetical protein